MEVAETVGVAVGVSSPCDYRTLRGGVEQACRAYGGSRGGVVCFGALVLISSTTPDVVIAVALFVSGALRSIGFTAYNSLAFADVDSGELTDANTLHATLQELASGLGIALSALVITLCTPLAESEDLSGGVPFSLTLGVLGAMLVPTVIESWRLPRDTGAVVLVRR